MSANKINSDDQQVKILPPQSAQSELTEGAFLIVEIVTPEILITS